MESKKKYPKSELTIKLLGSIENIEEFIEFIRSKYTKLDISPIIKNIGDNGFHCFINILDTPTASNESKTEQETP